MTACKFPACACTSAERCPEAKERAARVLSVLRDTPSEGEARQRAFNILSKHPQCLRDDEPLQDLIEDIAIAIRAAAQTYTEYCMNEKCPRGLGVPVEVVRISPDTPREGEK